jgi:hypothetical protein
MTCCGKTAKVLSEAAGLITLVCTLEPHRGKQHYDDAFCMSWKEI